MIFCLFLFIIYIGHYLYVRALLVCFRNRHQDFPSFLTHSSLDCRSHIWKKVSLIVFRYKFYQKFLPASFTIKTYLKKLIEIKSYNTKQCAAGLSTIIIPSSPVSPRLHQLYYHKKAKVSSFINYSWISSTLKRGRGLEFCSFFKKIAEWVNASRK